MDPLIIGKCVILSNAVYPEVCDNNLTTKNFSLVFI